MCIHPISSQQLREQPFPNFYKIIVLRKKKMSHSKRNTSLAFFTSHERAQLKSTWGSQATRLTRDSFLPFGSCQLCLLSAVDPVACTQGDMFCRECAMKDLLAQRKEMKRMEKEAERRKADEKEMAKLEEEELRERAVKEFEAVQMGLEGFLGGKGKGNVVGREGGKIVVEETKESGKKRKFEIDEEELMRIADEERARTKQKLNDEKKDSAKPAPSFWLPSATPSSASVAATIKQHPTCPCSNPSSPHPYSLKTLQPLNFTEEKDPSGASKSPIRACPSCHKTLTNATKAVFAIPCGHILCKPCVAKFMTPHKIKDAHNPEAEFGVLRCYVCEEDLSGKASKKEKQGGKDKLKPGLVEIRCEGTGFAGGGKNLVKREGVAFQC